VCYPRIQPDSHGSETCRVVTYGKVVRWTVHELDLTDAGESIGNLLSEIQYDARVRICQVWCINNQRKLLYQEHTNICAYR